MYYTGMIWWHVYISETEVDFSSYTYKKGEKMQGNHQCVYKN